MQRVCRHSQEACFEGWEGCPSASDRAFAPAPDLGHNAAALSYTSPSDPDSRPHSQTSPGDPAFVQSEDKQEKSTETSEFFQFSFNLRQPRWHLTLWSHFHPNVTEIHQHCCINAINHQPYHSVIGHERLLESQVAPGICGSIESSLWAKQKTLCTSAGMGALY